MSQLLFPGYNLGISCWLFDQWQINIIQHPIRNFNGYNRSKIIKHPIKHPISDHFCALNMMPFPNGVSNGPGGHEIPDAIDHRDAVFAPVERRQVGLCRSHWRSGVAPHSVPLLVM